MRKFSFPFLSCKRIIDFLFYLKEEYWAAAAKNFYESHEFANFDCTDHEGDKLINLIELWTAVGLYMKTDHVLLSDLPDAEMK